jgi:RNA polymerase sigma factor (sigma-70 family)
MQSFDAGDLVRCCATRRDSEVWADFVERFSWRLWAGVQRALSRYSARLSEDDREDLVQDIYCRLLEKRGRALRLCRSNAETAVGVYLGRVAESVVADHLRSENAVKRGRHLLRDVALEPGVDLAEIARDSGHSPEERLLHRERREVFLIRCREALNPRSRRRDMRIVYLALVEGWTSREICTLLGKDVTPGVIDSVIHRVKRRLARQGVEVPRRKPGVASRVAPTGVG